MKQLPPRPRQAPRPIRPRIIQRPIRQPQGLDGDFCWMLFSSPVIGF